MTETLADVKSPQGRRVIDEGRRQLSRPGNRSKLQALVARLRGRR